MTCRERIEELQASLDRQRKVTHELRRKLTEANKKIAAMHPIHRHRRN